MAFRVLQNGFPLIPVWFEVGVFGTYPIPVVAFQYAVVVRRRIILYKGFGSSVPTVDIPALGVVLSICLTHIVGYPRREIVVGDIEQSCDIVFATYHIQQGTSHIFVKLLKQVVIVLVYVYDLAHLSVKHFFERTFLQQCVTDIGHARCGKSHSHIV